MGARPLGAGHRLLHSPGSPIEGHSTGSSQIGIVTATMERYFIVIDDLWTTSVWDTVSRVFPDHDYCSRIITTTQIGDVALACCHYDLTYRIEMSPLNYSESAKIFFNRVFGSEGSCPADFKEVSGRIIRKCGGLPLTIMNIASLLASEPNLSVEQLKYIHDYLPSTLSSDPTSEGLKEVVNIHDYLPSTLSSDPTSEGLKEVINLIYHNLPPDLKTCLLYLSMYPEGYTVRKEDLVNHWVAEGFIGECQDRNNVARGYFDELVSRGMTLSVDTNDNGEVLSCTVHHTVLDFIRKKSIGENFVIVVDNLQSTEGIYEKVRRLSVQFGSSKSARMPENIRLSQVRSLLFSGFFVSVPSIVDYRLLRVLELHIWADQNKRNFDLTRMHQLVMLRYVKIECNITVKLPAKIRTLQYLGTLEVDARLSAFPSDINYLPGLLHLRLPSENVMNLGKLTSLQELFLTCNTETPKHLVRALKRLGSILGKFINLKYLILASGASSLSISCDGLSAVSPAPALLERIELLPSICIFPRLPQWFEKLTGLCVLKITVRELSTAHLVILQALRNLSALSLYIQKACLERIVFDKEGFAGLRYFRFRCSLPWLIFKVDGMPNLQKLKLDLDAPSPRLNFRQVPGPTPIIMEHLPGLQEISVKIGGATSDAQNAEYILNTAVRNHTSNPKINIHLVNNRFYGDEDTSMAIWFMEEEGDHYRQNIMMERKFSEQPLRSPMLPESSSSSRVPVIREPYLYSERKDAMVSAFTGAANSLGMKFAALMGEGYVKHTSTRTVVTIGKDELDFINDFLQHLAGIAELNMQLKNLRDQMKDITYDVDDSLDHLMVDLHILDHKDHSHYSLTKHVTEIIPRRWGVLEKSIHQLQDLVERARKADLPTMAEPLLPTLCEYNNRAITTLVGIDEPRNEINGKWIDGQQQLQVGCIFGDCGVGKTTLVTEVYNHIKEEFYRRVFITVSRNANFKSIHKNELRELFVEQYYNRDMKDLISHLQDKRYLVVFDGVWSPETWEDIKLALPDNNLGSRVIMTTSVSNVAESCASHASGFMYPMKTLEGYSRSLFESIIFDSKGMPTELEEVGRKILDACGGIPLAITMIAVLLASRPEEKAQWELVAKHMEPSGNGDLATERVGKAFHISYSSLPCDMKSCLLYLSVFPENHFIEKGRLIWRWIAEGLIPEKAEENPWETGESYFKQLMARKLIEQAYEEVQGEVLVGCQVHGLVHDLITSLSKEENFVRSNTNLDGVIRRLSVTEDTLELTRMNPSYKVHVRSFTCFVDGILFPDFSSMQSIRVLDFEGTRNFGSYYIGRLPLLRYLGLRGTDISMLPLEINESLHLETLDIRGTKIKEISSDILKLPRLVRVLAQGIETPPLFLENCGIQEISTINVAYREGVMFVADLLNKSKRLRILGIQATSKNIFLDEASGKTYGVYSSFLDKVAESNSLQSLFFHDFPQALVDSALESPALQKLYEFGLRIYGHLPRVPDNMANLTNNLIDLHITIPEVQEKGLHILGDLRKLALLRLHSTGSAQRRIKISKGFLSLKDFCYKGEQTAMTLQFKSKSMPQLRKLQLDFNAQKTTRWFNGDYAFGLEHLHCVRQVRVTINCDFAEQKDVEYMEAAIREQVSRIPNSPTPMLSRKNERLMRRAQG